MNDYLWDRSGPPDPFVAELEDLLAPLAHTPGPRRPRVVTVMREWALPLAGAAAVLFAVCLSILSPGARDATWSVDPLTGAPKLAASALHAASPLTQGQWLETGPDAEALIESDAVGWVTVKPDSRLRLARATRDEHRLELAHGSIEALILAPPRLFIVDTPAVTAVDMGCAYEMDIDEEGNGLIHVTAGWVHLELEGARTARVPSGAACVIRKGRGAGTPRFTDAPEALLEALDRYDEGDIEALATILEHARPRDSLTVWHIALGASGDDRRQVIRRLDELAPRPRAVPAGDDVSDHHLKAWWRRVGESW